MSAAELRTRLDFHGGGELLEACAREDVAWLQINAPANACHIAGPEVIVYFDRGIAGCKQINALIEHLQEARARLLEYAEAQLPAINLADVIGTNMQRGRP